MSDAAPKLSRDAVERLAERLADGARSLAEKLLPGGHHRGHLYRAAPRRNGGPGDSLTVDTGAGKWRYFGADPPAMLRGETFGDMLDLIRLTQGVDKAEARAWALRYLGLAPGAVEFKRTPADEAAARKAAAEKVRADMEKVDRRRKSDRALWLSCQPISLQDAAGQYLAWRIPGFPRLLELGWGLKALRFHPQLEHPYAQGRCFPAMLALCQFPGGKVAALHRYFLTWLDMAHRWDVLREKRDGLAGKLASTALEGAFIPVWRGSRADAETGELREGWSWSDERAGPEVVVCEGVEDALSLATVDEDRRYAAALSLPNFGQIKLPEWARKVVWFADDDGDNQQTPKLLDRALERLEEQGRDVAIARPPPGFKDANAALRGEAV